MKKIFKRVLIVITFTFFVLVCLLIWALLSSPYRCERVAENYPLIEPMCLAYFEDPELESYIEKHLKQSGELIINPPDNSNG